MKSLSETTLEDESQPDEWVADRETKSRFERNGAIAGFSTALLLVVSSKSLCEFSTSSTACGFGSAGETLVVSIIVGVLLTVLGWWLGRQLSTENPVFRRLDIAFFSLFIIYQLFFPILLHQFLPQWKVNYWDGKWADWSHGPLLIIYLAAYYLIKYKIKLKLKQSQT